MMANLFVGIIIGIVVATVGVSRFANWADSGVHKVQKVAREVVK
jgi:hypothetical protein